MLKALTTKLNQKKKKGFTLIELIIVIAIIAILAAIAIPKFSSITKSANVKADISNAKTIESAVTKLVAENKLPAGTYTVKDTATIADELQTVPTGKFTSGNFSVTVDANGKVVVSIDSTQVTGATTGEYAN